MTKTIAQKEVLLDGLAWQWVHSHGAAQLAPGGSWAPGQGPARRRPKDRLMRYQHFPRRQRRLRIRREMMHLWPGRERDLGFWACVVRRMKAARIRPADVEAVRRVCSEVEASLAAERRRRTAPSVQRSTCVGRNG